MIKSNLEHTFTKKVMADYRKQGFELFLEPQNYPDYFPQELKNYHPDIVALKGNEKILIEVVYNLNNQKLSQIQHLTSLIDNNEWKLKVINISEEE